MQTAFADEKSREVGVSVAIINDPITTMVAYESLFIGAEKVNLVRAMDVIITYLDLLGMVQMHVVVVFNYVVGVEVHDLNLEVVFLESVSDGNLIPSVGDVVDPIVPVIVCYYSAMDDRWLQNHYCDYELVMVDAVDYVVESIYEEYTIN